MFLLSLVGEQPIPVLIPLWQQWTSPLFASGEVSSPFTSVQFAGSKNTLSVIANLEAVLRREPGLQHLDIRPALTIDPYDTHTAMQALGEALDRAEKDGFQSVMNISGGTKLMALAALQAARRPVIAQSGVSQDVRLLYVNTEKNRIMFLNAAGDEIGSEDIYVSLSIRQYLEAHGLEVSDNQAFNPNNVYADKRPPRAGDALEMRVMELSRDSGYFDEVRRNVFIRKAVPNSKPVSNELDVVAISNGRLVVCSCKAGINLKKEMVYELAALSRRETAGIYCGKVLALGQEDIPPGICERAKADHIRLVRGSEIDRIALIMHLETR
ncbi:MAG: DUF1887 family protein [Leptolinea sp.]|jgi:hypothetical protein|nr:DUF1887 family protein [Leptolinea sp.]